MVRFGPRICLFYGALLAGLLIAIPLRAADDAANPSEIYDKFVSKYMAGQWDDLDAGLKANAKLHLKYTAAQKADVDYITATLAECHPAWWNSCKAAKRTPIRVSIFGTQVSATYDPQQKDSMKANFDGTLKDFILGWPAGDMDNPQQAEHGFTKGELQAGGVWSTFGYAAAYSQMSTTALTSTNEAEKLKLIRILDFRGNLAAIYYGNPRARQWWLFLSLHYYKGEYAKSQNVMSRKALGAMFVAELATHPADYPSIKLPSNLKPENAEEQLVKTVHDRIERHGWTLAEDKLIREATSAFAAANSKVVQTGGPVKLANGLLVSLDPKEDAELHKKRDEWLVKQEGKK
jgi:hypothetical protein